MYPLTRKWFLATYPSYKENEISKEECSEKEKALAKEAEAKAEAEKKAKLSLCSFLSRRNSCFTLCSQTDALFSASLLLLLLGISLSGCHVVHRMICFLFSSLPKLTLNLNDTIFPSFVFSIIVAIFLLLSRSKDLESCPKDVKRHMLDALTYAKLYQLVNHLGT